MASQEEKQKQDNKFNANANRNRNLLAAPIKSPVDKFQLLPAFLKTRGVVKTHIDSFNYFVNRGIKKIMDANSYHRLTDTIYLRYLNIHVGDPYLPFENKQLTPQFCRLSDTTYSADISVDIEYTDGKGQPTKKAGVKIGRLPIMLRSCKCVLNGRDETDLAKLGECPLDPGGYFVVKGTEKGWKTFFEEPIMLIAFVLLGKNLELRAKLKAASDMTGLLNILPTKAQLLVDSSSENSSYIDVSCNSLSVGDMVIVLPGVSGWLPVAAGALLPVTGTILTPSIAGALMGFSSVGVMANSLVLRVKMDMKHSGSTCNLQQKTSLNTIPDVIMDVTETI